MARVAALVLPATLAGQRPAAVLDSARALDARADSAYRGQTAAALGRAVTLWGDAAAAYARADRPADEAAVLQRTGVAYWDLSRGDSALAYFHRALPLARTASDRAGEGAALDGIGQVLARTGPRDSAVAYLQQALVVRHALGDQRGQGWTLNALGDLHQQAGRLDSAAAYFAQALALARAAGNQTGEARALHAVALLRALHDEPDSALAIYGQALARWRMVGDRRNEARTLHNVGAVYIEQGRSDSARAVFRRVLATMRELGDRRGEARALQALGVVAMQTGEPDTALAALRRVVALGREVGDEVLQTRTLNAIGSVYGTVGRPDSALASFRQAADAAHRAGLARDEIVALTNIGSLYRELGRPDSARVVYGTALSAARALGDRSRVADALYGLGNVMPQVAQADSAFALYGEALTLYRAAGDRLGESGALHGLGDVHDRRGHPDSALAYYGQALALRRALHEPQGEALALAASAHVYARGPHPAARDLARAAAALDTAAAAFAAMRREVGNDANAIGVAERMDTLYTDWALTWLARGDGVGAAAALAAADRGRARALLARARGAGAAGPAAVGSAVVGSAAVGPGAVGPGAAGAMADPTRPGADLAAEAAALLGPLRARRTAVLTYLFASDSLVTWLLTPAGELHVFRAAASRAGVMAQVRALRGGLDGPPAAGGGTLALARTRSALGAAEPDAAPRAGMDVSVPDALARLSALLLPAGLRASLSDGADLLVVPTGPLALVPFAALPLGPSGEPLGARAAVRYVPSLAAAGASAGASAGAFPRPGGGGDALVVGDPTMPALPGPDGRVAPLAALPAAGAEARWIAARLGTRALTGAAATESAVRARLPRARVVHLATHGYAFNAESRTRDSFVALAPDASADGLLTVGELLDAAGPPLRAELVVLSGCQTGLGNLTRAEGTVGLARAFLARGAGRVLVSLWNVSDRATALLMRRFYAHALGDPDRPAAAEALRRAQADVRRTPGYADPRYWAGFQLVGAR